MAANTALEDDASIARRRQAPSNTVLTRGEMRDTIFHRVFALFASSCFWIVAFSVFLRLSMLRAESSNDSIRRSQSRWMAGFGGHDVPSELRAIGLESPAFDLAHS